MTTSARLTPKQERFAVEYVRTGNASEAYRRAYSAGRMAEKTIHETASRLLRDPKVAARVDDLRAELSEAALLDEARTLRTMASLAYFDPVDLFDEDGNLLPVRRMRVHARLAIASIKTKRIPGTPAVVDEVKLWNRSTALDALAKVHGIYGRTPLPALARATTLAEQGQAVISAMADGDIAPRPAASTLQALAAQARIVELDELVKRVEALEASHGEKS